MVRRQQLGPRVRGGRVEQRAELGADRHGEPGGSAGDPQAAAVVPAQDQFLRRADCAGHTADDRLGDDPGAQLLTRPYTGPVGLSTHAARFLAMSVDPHGSPTSGYVSL